MSGIVDRFGIFLATSRRGYPIPGRRKLRLFDATKHASKPVYLRLGFRGRSRDQLGPVREVPGSVSGPVLGPVLGSVLGPVLGPVLELVIFRVKSQSNGSMNRLISKYP